MTLPLSRFVRPLLFLHLFLSPLLFQRGLIEVFETPKVAALTFTAILLLAALVAQQVVFSSPGGTSPKEKGGSKRAVDRGPRDLIAWGFLLYLASALLSTLFSMSWRTSLYGEHENFVGLITVAAYVALFFGTRAFCRNQDQCKTILIAAVLATAVLSLYGTVQAIGKDPFTWKRTAEITGSVTRIFGTMGHPNHLGAFLVMGLPILSFFRIEAWGKRSWPALLLLPVIEALASALIIFSYSRGAWVALIGLSVLIAILLAMTAKKKWVILCVLFPWIVGAGLGAATFSTVMMETATPVPTLQPESPDAALPAETRPVEPDLLAPSAPPLWERVKQMGPSALIHGTRWPIWTAAVNMFLDHPVLGVGLDCFRLAFEQYRPKNYWLLEWGGTPTHAHNELLHILAAQGSLGVLAAFVLTAGIGIAFARLIKRNGSFFGVAVLSGIVVFYIQNLFSFTVIGTGTLFVTFAAILSRLDKSDEPLQESRPNRAETEPSLVDWRLVPIGIIAGMGVYFFVYQPTMTNLLFSKTVFNRSLPPQTAVSRLEEVVRRNPNRDLYFHHLAATYRKAARATTQPEEKREFLKLARGAYQRAIDLVPVDSHHYLSLANLLLVLSKESPPLAGTGEVYTAMKKALKLDPYNADFYVIATDIAIASGDAKSGERWAMKALEIYPDFAPSKAQLGFIALMSAYRAFRENQPAEVQQAAQVAVDHLERSLGMEWQTYKDKKEAAPRDLAKAYLFKAKAEEDLGKIGAARASYNRLLEVSPNDPSGTRAFNGFRNRHPLILSLK
jgi:O-antigen ligase/tetratricopeptide (TPR) repeat protein